MVEGGCFAVTTARRCGDFSCSSNVRLQDCFRGTTERRACKHVHALLDNLGFCTHAQAHVCDSCGCGCAARVITCDDAASTLTPKKLRSCPAPHVRGAPERHRALARVLEHDMERVKHCVCGRFSSKNAGTWFGFARSCPSYSCGALSLLQFLDGSRSKTLVISRLSNHPLSCSALQG